MEQVNHNQKYKNSLILIALGPSGTVLAHRLTQLDYQALDIGHITSSYEEAFASVRNSSSK